MREDTENSIAVLRGRKGLTLVELALASAILLVAILGLVAALLSSVRLGEVTRESALASEAARRMIEQIQETDFDDIFVTYNSEPSDDPDGAGTAPGADFEVDGLEVQDADADGFAGQIVFPTSAADPGLLDESVVDEELGMPRDLDGDNADPPWETLSSGYLLLPVEVRVEWVGRGIERTHVLRTMLAE